MDQVSRFVCTSRAPGTIIAAFAARAIVVQKCVSLLCRLSFLPTSLRRLYWNQVPKELTSVVYTTV